MSNNKIRRIDGLPGITMPGYKGTPGSRGGEIIFAKVGHSESDELDMLISVGGKDVPIYSTNKKNTFTPSDIDLIFLTDNGRNIIYSMRPSNSANGVIPVDELDAWTQGATIEDLVDINVVFQISELTYTKWNGSDIQIQYETE